MKLFTIKLYGWLMLMMVVTACREDNSFKKLPLVGQWSATQVTCDGILQSAWNGQTVNFNQISIDSGTYQFPETPYDSIWNKQGSWKTGISTGDLFFLRFNPQLSVNYTIANNTLIVSMLLPYYPTQSITSPVLPVVHGNWTFQFERK